MGALLAVFERDLVEISEAFEPPVPGREDDLGGHIDADAEEDDEVDDVDDIDLGVRFARRDSSDDALVMMWLLW